MDAQYISFLFSSAEQVTYFNEAKWKLVWPLLRLPFLSEAAEWFDPALMISLFLLKKNEIRTQSK